MSEAQKILNPRLDRTLKERARMAEYYAPTFDWGRDTISYKFADGSALMFLLNEHLEPLEVIEVQA